MRKILSLLLVLILAAGSLGTAAADVVPLHGGPVVGIAWRPDLDSEFFTNVCRTVEAAGGTWVLLDQVTLPDLVYTEDGKLTEGVVDTGALNESAARLVRCNTWHGSNAAEAVGDVDLVIFTGGEDISPSLYYIPETWHGIPEEMDYNAERDISDYLTMSYCLDHDIPVVGFCRGMQMLSVISGADVIQDIPTWFDEQGLDYENEHRRVSGNSGNTYASHDVQVVEGSFAWQILGTETIHGCPSWHHQAVLSVAGTRLNVSGYTETSGIRMIEIVERTDKKLAIGFQFHPEAAFVKHLDGTDDSDSFMDPDTALNVFVRLFEIVCEPAENAA